MAITFNGTVKTYLTYGNDALTQNLFTIENGIASRVNILLRHLELEVDSIVVNTAVSPVAKLSRATGISGGVILEKGQFNTSQSSDANVAFRTTLMDSARITATPGDAFWQQFIGRMHTAAWQQEQMTRLSGTEIPTFPFRSMIPNPGPINCDIRIRPGQAMLLQVVSAVVASNAALMTNYAVTCSWDEDSVSTFTIGGTVTLSSSPVTGAKVTVIQADDVDMTNPVLVGIITTPAGGAWSSTIVTGKVGFAYVQYRNGSKYYTAPGSPYLS